MTEQQAVLFLLRQGPKTCGDFIRYTFTGPDGKFRGLAAEYRARISELRKAGYGIHYDRREKLYWLTHSPEAQSLGTSVGAAGQVVFDFGRGAR